MTPSAEADSPSRSPKRRSIWPIATGITLTLVASGLVLFVAVGRWLVVENPLEKAQAIVVLSGGLPIRAIEAARLYHQGYAPQIWLTRPEEPDASLAPMGIPNSGEDYLNLRVLAHENIPPSAIRVLEPAINNTADEIRAAAAELAREDAKVVIIVTTKAHTRRVRRLWSQLAPANARAIIRATPDDSFDPAHWWRTTQNALDVVREVLGLLNSYAGLPLHPKT
jgi:uncharacterized SAM-binding protein YcdF (DUF218 family)